MSEPPGPFEVRNAAIETGEEAIFYILLDDGCRILLDDGVGALILDESQKRLWIRQLTEQVSWDSQKLGAEG